ncbi:MAG: hypothetical protein EXS05_19500 [Planctomycetaceae bacterium]|nr:hypothetical protein [Planctomycetaceae bacterium]
MARIKGTAVRGVAGTGASNGRHRRCGLNRSVQKVLHRPVGYGTNRDMWQSYIGIASRHGLENFCPEQPHTVQFLSRRVERSRGRLACFWTVLPDEIAGLVRVALQLGCAREAWDLMQQHARDWGSLLPADDESPWQFSGQAPQ